MTRSAIFLDRDGTLNELVYRNKQLLGPRMADQFRLFPDVEEVDRRLRKLDYLVFVVTNQPDIARGFLDPVELEKMTRTLMEAIRVDEVLICPHDDRDNCKCRKPKPGMLIDLADRWNVDLKLSYMVGDLWKDVVAGQTAGCFTIQIGRPKWRQPYPNVAVETLMDAIKMIESNSNGT